MPKTTKPLGPQRGVSTNIILTVVVVVVAAAVIGGVLLFSGNRGGPGSGDAPPVPAEVLRKPDSNTLTEAPDNRVTVVEFLDYQCPACAQYYKGVTSKIEQDYAGRITFVTRNYPLDDMHPLAVPAAKAAEAAALQGKYKEMYHALYQNWQKWAVADNGQEVSNDEQKATRLFEQYAQQIGLDQQKFRQDRESPEVQRRIDRDRADGTHAGVEGTPSIFVNGRLVESDATTFDEIRRQLREQIDQELAK